MVIAEREQNRQRFRERVATVLTDVTVDIIGRTVSIFTTTQGPGSVRSGAWSEETRKNLENGEPVWGRNHNG